MVNRIAVRVRPFKRWSDVANATRHGRREDPAKHVDRALTRQNVHYRLIEIAQVTGDRGEVIEHGDWGVIDEDGDNGLDIAEEFKALAERTGAKWRKNAIVGTEVLFIASPGFFRGERGSLERKAHAEAWAMDCMSALRTRYPQQTACARLDLDETTPHLSVFMLPTYEKTYGGEKRRAKRARQPRRTISHNQVFGSPEQLSALQDWAAEAMAARGHDLHRGVRKATRGPDHLTPAEGRRRIAAAAAEAARIEQDAAGRARQRAAETRQEAEEAHRRVRELKRREAALEASVARLEADEAALRAEVRLSEDGAANFDAALGAVQKATEAAVGGALTREAYRDARTVAFKHSDGRNRRFAVDDAANQGVIGFIRAGFERAVALARRFLEEPSIKARNAYDALYDAVIDTLRRLGVAEQRPDLGAQGADDDAPTVLEMIFREAEENERSYNADHLADYDPPNSGPSR